MKISTDPSDIYNIKRPVMSPDAASVIPRQMQQMDTRFIEAVISRLNTDRSIGDAMSIANMSRTLMQKAMEVSSRLRDLAQKTTADSVASAESASLDEISVMSEGVMAAAAGSSSPELKALPDISPELASLREQAAAGSGADLSAIEAAQTGLRTKAESAAEIEASLAGTPGISADTGFTFDVPGTAALIGSQPGTALAAQGNIHGESAAALLS